MGSHTYRAAVPGHLNQPVGAALCHLSAMKLLEAFSSFQYPNAIGPGVYDIHSPRVPSQQDMEALLEKALRVLSLQQLWVNPDCGLKTRGWAEVRPALVAMVAAAKAVRASAGPEQA